MVVEQSEDVVTLVISESRSALRRRGFVGALCPPPPSGQDVRDHLTAAPGLVTQVVGDLVAAMRLTAVRAGQ